MLYRVGTGARAIAIAVLAGAFAVGCGGGSKKPVREIPPETASVTKKRIDKYESSETAELLAAETKKSKKLAKSFRGSLDKEAHAHFEHDPALDVLASVHLFAFAASGTFPARSLSTWLMWKLGVAGNYVAGNAWSGKGQGIKTLLTNAMKETARELKLRKYRYAYGVSRVTLSGKVVAQALVIVRKNILVFDLPKFYEPGETILLRGRILVPYRKPTVYMDLSTTAVHSEAIEPAEDGKFAIKLTAPQQPGRHFIEILTEDPDPEAADLDDDETWQHSLLMLPIYVGVDEPDTPDAMILKPPANPPDKTTWAARILYLYNQERAEKGLPEIELHPGVSSLADKRALQYIDDPDLPPDSELLTKAEELGLDIGAVLQSQGYLEYVDEHAWFNLLSPSHRKRLFSPGTTHAGIGIVEENPFQHAFVEYLLGQSSVVVMTEIVPELIRPTLDKMNEDKQLFEPQELARANELGEELLEAHERGESLDKEKLSEFMVLTARVIAEIADTADESEEEPAADAHAETGEPPQ